MNVEGSPNTDPTKKVLSNSGASGTCRHTLPLRTEENTGVLLACTEQDGSGSKMLAIASGCSSEFCNSTDALRVLETAGTVFHFRTSNRGNR